MIIKTLRNNKSKKKQPEPTKKTEPTVKAAEKENRPDDVSVSDSIYLGGVEPKAIPEEITEYILRNQTRSEFDSADADENKQQTGIAGWLVALNTDIKGNCFTLQTGINKIGKGEYVDIDLSHDSDMQYGLHAVIVYDNNSRQFYLDQCGFNDVRLDGDYLTEKISLQAHAVVSVGGTRLYFVPLCGKDFSWDDI